MAAKTFRDVALADMRRAGFPNPYLDSYALNELKPLGRRAGGGTSNQFLKALLVMGRYCDSRAFNSTNPDLAEVQGALYGGVTLADLASRTWNEGIIWNHTFFSDEFGLANKSGWINNTRALWFGFEWWIKRASTGAWYQHRAGNDWSGHPISPTFSVEDFAGTWTDFRTDNGFSSVRLLLDPNAPFASEGAGYWPFHGYYGRAFFDHTDVADFLVLARVSKVVNNASLLDDRDLTMFAISLGMDLMPQPFIYLYPSVGVSRHKPIKAKWPEWQFVVMHTMTEAQLQAPGGLPAELANLVENFDEGGAPVVLQPPGPVPPRGRWVNIFNPSSPRGRWLDIGAATNVAPVWGGTVPLTATIGVPFSYTPPLLAGSPAPSYSKVSGPTWASVNATTREITGTPTGSPVETTIIVRANNGTGGNVDLTLPLSVVAAPPAVSVVTTSLPNAVQSQAYSETLTATGVAPFVWALTAGTLPAGTTLQGAVISGTPTTIATASFTVQVTDALGRTATQALSITVGAASSLPVITTPTLPAGTVGVAYSQTIAATGTGTINRLVVSGTLPPGLTLAPTTGALTGTPTAAGGYGFTVRATNAFGYTEATYYLIIAAAGIAPVASPWGQFVRQ